MRKIILCQCVLFLGCEISAQNSLADELLSVKSADTQILFSMPRQIVKLTGGGGFKDEPTGFGVGDVDRDGNVDLLEVLVWCDWNGLSCNGYSGSLIVYRGNGHGDFECPAQIAEVVIPRTCIANKYYKASDVMKIIAGDFDRDGDLDLIANCFGDILLYENVTTKKETAATGESNV